MGNNDVKSTGQYALRHLFYDNDVVLYVVTYTLTGCWLLKYFTRPSCSPPAVNVGSDFQEIICLL